VEKPIWSKRRDNSFKYGNLGGYMAIIRQNMVSLGDLEANALGTYLKTRVRLHPNWPRLACNKADADLHLALSGGHFQRVLWKDNRPRQPYLLNVIGDGNCMLYAAATWVDPRLLAAKRDRGRCKARALHALEARFAAKLRRGLCDALEASPDLMSMIPPEGTVTRRDA
jgi:hypothetical protein